jgi:predicted amidohydrolase
MEKLKISSAQFENKSGDKDYNLSVIGQLSERASHEGSRVVAFHECSVTGYTFAQDLSKKQLLEIAEYIPDGPSIQTLTRIARKNDVAICAGLFERDKDNNIFNTYVCVDAGGVVATFRKIHPFISPFLSAGSEYCVFELYGWKCGILICYDNNIVENVRATRLLGADIIFMPHVTMCTPSTRPGAGFVDPALWGDRESNPTPLRLEFDGMKGRAWLMKWLPSRAYDNGIYAVFTNPIGMDGDQLKNGCSMILDPFGDVIAECRTLGDDIVSATLTPDKLQLAGGYRYLQARKPGLYREIIGGSHTPEQKVSWR